MPNTLPYLVLAGRPLTWLAIVVSNLIPAAGVAFLGWDATPILILYWIENLALGALALPRIIASRGAVEGETARPGHAGASGCFFAVHYGLFCVGHGIFAFILAHQLAAAGGPGAPGVWERTLGSADFLWLVAAVVLISLALEIKDWWWPGRWRDASPTLEMFRPYGRIAVLHLTVLGGAWLMARFETPAWTVLLLCLAKLVLELVIAVLARQTGWRVAS